MIKLADLFLHPDVKRQGAHERLRVRLLAFTFLTLGGFALIHLLTFLFTPLVLASAGIQLGLVLMNSCFLLWLRSSASYEKVIVCFLVISTVILCLTVVFNAKSILSTAIYVFPCVLLYAFLACRKTSTGLMLTGFLFLCNLYLYSMSYRMGFYPPFGLKVDDFVKRSIVSMLSNHGMALIWMAIFTTIKKHGEEEYDRETKWMLRSSKLQEIASLASAIRLQMEQPLLRFRQEWKSLISDQDPPESVASQQMLLLKMEADLGLMIEVSRSFGWIYRSYRNESNCPASVETLLAQLQLLLEGTAAQRAWKLRFLSAPAQMKIHGPIPSLMLLFVSLIHQIFDSHPKVEDRQINFEVKGNADLTYWIISWPESGASLSDPQTVHPRPINQSLEDMRKDLIAELVRDCGARLARTIDKKQNQIVILGNWLVST